MCSWQKMRNENFWLDSVWWFGCDFDNLWCCDCFCIASWKSISYLVYNRMIQLQDTLDWNGDRYGYTVGRERYIRSGHTVDQEMSAQFWYLLFDTSLKRWNDNKIKCWWNQIYVYILNGAINHCSLSLSLLWFRVPFNSWLAAMVSGNPGPFTLPTSSETEALKICLIQTPVHSYSLKVCHNTNGISCVCMTET